MTAVQLDRLAAKHFSLPEVIVLTFLAASHGHVASAMRVAMAEGFAMGTFTRVFDHLLLEGVIERRNIESVGVRLLSVYHALLDGPVQ